MGRKSEKQKSAKKSEKVEKKAAIYDALIKAANDGIKGDALLAHIREHQKDVDAKAIFKAGIKALGDAKITVRSALDAIYDLAISQRLEDKASVPSANENTSLKPSPKKKKKSAA